MTRFPRLVLALLLLGAAGPADAQPPLTLDEAIRKARADNATLRASRAARDGAEAAADAQRGAWFPRVNVSESWQRGDQPVFVFSSLLASRQFGAANFAIDALNHPSPIGYFHTSVGVEQLVFDGGAREARIGTANLQRQLADASARDAESAVAVSVAELYARLLSLQSTTRSVSGALDAAREDLARAVRRRDAGMATEADVLALAVHVADLEQRGIQADGDLAVVRAQLNRAMGAAIDSAFTVMEPAAPASPAGSSLEALFAEATSQRVEVQQAAAREQIAALARRSARGAFAPQVAAQAAVDVSGTRIGDRAASWVLGAEVRWSLATGGTERGQLRAATADVMRARAEASDVRAQIQVDVVSALRQWQAAAARQAVGRAAVDQARESERIVRDRFDAGLAPVNDVLRAAAAVLDAEAQRASAAVDAIVAQARLNRALGRRP
jgi:outer membrane protein TolC